jgi:NAD(P)-dependent dehydrogenase (short-subunit alcohol dehydrogenase family)
LVNDLTSETAWIVGDNGGIGTACARVLAEDGLRYMLGSAAGGHHVPGGCQRCR